ncbi:hypothetical protein AX16_001719 [Volvariella volvacea WC 439]|nr:hypothetical protein AX16_001719 [Volvariella volvacea WC 439]
MNASLVKALTQNSGLVRAIVAPRIQFHGSVAIPPHVKLPPLEDVRREVKELPAIIKEGPHAGINVLVSGTTEKIFENAPAALAFNTQLPNLFRFAYLVDVRDVPEDLFKPIIWALKMSLRVLTKPQRRCSVVLVTIRLTKTPTKPIISWCEFYAEIQDFHSLNNIQTTDTRIKLASHLMNPCVNKPVEAIPYLKECIDADTERYKRFKSGVNPWMEHPVLFHHYGEALIHSSLTEAKTIFEKALEMHPRIRANLVLVLSELEIEDSVREGHEDWAVKFLKKSPNLIPEDELQFILIKPRFKAHPILMKLGGEKWFKKWKNTISTDARLSKLCRTCERREPDVKLSRCSGCKYMWYCSKECQTTNWPLHKVACREMAEENRRIEKLKQEDPEAGQREEDWAQWRTSSHSFNLEAEASALQLHRNDEFTIRSVGVFKIDESLEFIEMMMGINAGEGKEYIDDLLKEYSILKGGSPLIPILFLAFHSGRKVGPYLGCSAISLERLRRSTYDREWRKLINKKNPPKDLRIQNGPQDRENVF